MGLAYFPINWGVGKGVVCKYASPISRVWVIYSLCYRENACDVSCRTVICWNLLDLPLPPSKRACPSLTAKPKPMPGRKYIDLHCLSRRSPALARSIGDLPPHRSQRWIHWRNEGRPPQQPGNTPMTDGDWIQCAYSDRCIELL